MQLLNHYIQTLCKNKHMEFYHCFILNVHMALMFYLITYTLNFNPVKCTKSTSLYVNNKVNKL